LKAFTYYRATTPANAVQAVAERSQAQFIGGGTNLLDLMKLEIDHPERLVDVNHLGLDTIEPAEAGGLRIGASVRNSDLAADMRVRRDYPVLARALLSGASPQLRNRATTAGNLLQRTRCPYFYETALPCNKRQPGSGCAAIGGYSRNHAILGVSDACIATNPSDMAVAMRVLDATVETIGAGDTKRTIPVADLHRLPGSTPHIETNLRPGELITAVILPPPIRGEQIYRKVRDRASYAFATISVAMILRPDGEARFSFGGLAPRPWRLEDAEAVVNQGADAVADRVLAGARTTAQNAFKLPLLRYTLAAVLRQGRKHS
jgi:xanthine dehydrogenase YagS FAD-binding subunit